jgi:DNA-binding PadR family transcriptional regulator
VSKEFKKMFGKHHFGFGSKQGDFWGGWNKEPRARRGDIKFFILEVLQEKPSHGYEIIRTLEERNNGMYKPSPGSVYPTLQMLEEGGYLSSEAIDGKKIYTITDSGRELIKERGERTPEPNPEVPPQPAIDIKSSAFKLAEAVRQGMKIGDPETVRRIILILDKARKEIYIVLSEL